MLKNTYKPKHMREMGAMANPTKVGGESIPLP